MSRIDWDKLCSYYNSIKTLYIDCEETDPELKTNLQPLNEFRAALDHLMRINTIEHLGASVNFNTNIEEEAKKLLGHFKRAFYDICDTLSMNYRNKIIDILEKYDPETITKAIPDYYSNIRPDIERISADIAELRIEKGFSKTDPEVRMRNYKEIIDKLQSYYKQILNSTASLEELYKDKLKQNASSKITQVVIPIVAIIAGSIVGIIGWLI